MARRSGAMGKPVEELTDAELVAERDRCKRDIPGRSRLVAKLLGKRLREIEKRLEKREE